MVARLIGAILFSGAIVTAMLLLVRADSRSRVRCAWCGRKGTRRDLYEGSDGKWYCADFQACDKALALRTFKSV